MALLDQGVLFGANMPVIAGSLATLGGENEAGGHGLENGFAPRRQLHPWGS